MKPIYYLFCVLVLFLALPPAAACAEAEPEPNAVVHEFGPLGASIRYLLLGDSWSALAEEPLRAAGGGCPIEVLSIGGTGSLLWLEDPVVRQMIADSIAASPEPVIAWLTVGLIDRAFIGVPAETVAARGESLALLLRELGAWKVVHVGYNLPGSATNIVADDVEWFSLVDSQGIWHEVLDVSDLAVDGDGTWHTDDRGGWQRIAAVHARSLWIPPCGGAV